MRLPEFPKLSNRPTDNKPWRFDKKSLSHCRARQARRSLLRPAGAMGSVLRNFSSSTAPPVGMYIVGPSSYSSLLLPGMIGDWTCRGQRASEKLDLRNAVLFLLATCRGAFTRPFLHMHSALSFDGIQNLQTDANSFVSTTSTFLTMHQKPTREVVWSPSHASASPFPLLNCSECPRPSLQLLLSSTCHQWN